MKKEDAYRYAQEQIRAWTNFQIMSRQSGFQIVHFMHQSKLRASVDRLIRLNLVGDGNPHGFSDSEIDALVEEFLLHGTPVQLEDPRIGAGAGTNLDKKDDIKMTEFEKEMLKKASWRNSLLLGLFAATCVIAGTLLAS
ncbi:hypothetical protein K0504_09665 [Neiella marina]|uniref:Uncharacterized protein n=1 Tax=Neiella holothuriorum TaxID=2870530 RepID=A0ABS7EHD1_9GAMM|nr:hypothetical protein [Neiella holothuriorum]MBW8191303.1 hypothetical protein [Neiella holothuriorum]